MRARSVCIAVAVTSLLAVGAYGWSRVRNEIDPEITTARVYMACHAFLAKSRDGAPTPAVPTNCKEWASASSSDILDKWERTLKCEMDEGRPELVSYGADGVLGGVGSDLDIRCGPDNEKRYCVCKSGPRVVSE